MRGVGVGALCRGVRGVPVGASVVVVDEEELFGFAVHRLEVEDAAVGDEGLEPLLVASGQEVDRITAVRGADAPHAGLVGPRLARHVVDGREVVADVLPGVVSRDLVEPLLPERRYAAAVRGHDDISLCGHELEVPAVAPAVCHDALGASLAVEQRGILLRGVEVRREDHPREHLLAVGGPHPSLLHLAHADVFVDRAVDCGDLLQGPVGGVHRVELRGRGDRGQLGDDPSAGHREGVDAVVALRENLDLAVHGRHAADLERPLDRGHEPEPVVALPDDVLGVVVEILRQVAHLGRRAVVEEQPRLVRLVARAALREEGDLRIVGRPDGILVISREVLLQPFDRLSGVEVRGLADVLRGARGDVVDEDVRIGRDGVLRAGQGFARVGQHRPGVVPGDLGHVEVGGQRGVPRRIGAEDVGAFLHALGPEVADEDVQVFTLVPVVPVAYHQVVVDPGLRLVHVLVDVCRAAVGDLHALHVPRLVAAGRDAEPFDIAREVRQLAHVAARGRHLPHLHRAAAIREEVDVPPVGAPAGCEAVRRAVAQARHGLRVELLDPEGRHAAVFRHVVVCLLVDEALPVGRERGAARAAHLPHHLGGEEPGGDLPGRQRVVDLQGFGTLPVAGAQPQSCNSHHQDDFFHFR